MIKNILLITIRNIYRHKANSFINIIGLAIGIACAIVVFLYINNKLTYDKYLPEYANINLNRTINVGSYPPKAWGLYDMHGNVKEWVADDYYQYTSESKTDPIAPHYYGKMLRGGGYKGWITGSRSAHRYAHLESMSDQGAGLRLAISITTKPIK